ncbi:MAG TPA: hypothetical protein VFD60_05120, partial [Nitrososphaeraceae archaeon]|nr:hypothetical protein [Nitrososphaeraceae archaeon]
DKQSYQLDLGTRFHVVMIYQQKQICRITFKYNLAMSFALLAFASLKINFINRFLSPSFVSRADTCIIL